MKYKDLPARIKAHKAQELDQEEIIKLYQDLLDSGEITRLGGIYQRQAKTMIDAGVLKGPNIKWTFDPEYGYIRDSDGDVVLTYYMR